MDSYEAILQGLRQATEKWPELSETIRLYTELLEAQAQVHVPLPVLTPPDEAATARLQEGIPLLVPEELAVDPEALRQLCFQIGFTTATHRRELVKPLARIHAWLHERQYPIEVLAQEYLREGRIREGEEVGLDGALLAFVFNNALRPFLRAQAEALAPKLADDEWYRGYCPICGGKPDFAALEKENGARRLLCSRCDMEWHYRRIGCPFCGEEANVAYYPSDDNVYRLYVCGVCRRYLKTVDQRQLAELRSLPVERILTIPMDIAAQDAGYLSG